MDLELSHHIEVVLVPMSDQISLHFGDAYFFLKVVAVDAVDHFLVEGLDQEGRVFLNEEFLLLEQLVLIIRESSPEALGVPQQVLQKIGKNVHQTELVLGQKNGVPEVSIHRGSAHQDYPLGVYQKTAAAEV